MAFLRLLYTRPGGWTVEALTDFEVGEVVDGLVGASSMGGVGEGVNIDDDQLFHQYRGCVFH